MQVAEYVVNKLIDYGVTDTFGVPGGVVLKLIYAMKEKTPILVPHLNYHEQMAGFAACGYSQASGKLGVAYATRGPGIANMVTCIAEAYQESLPVLFITAHGQRNDRGMRFENSQELDIVSMITGITKYAANIDSREDVTYIVKTACELALNGRRGPVLLDFNASLWGEEITEDERVKEEVADCEEDVGYVVDEVCQQISTSKRPIILLGDGVRHRISRERLQFIANQLSIPVLSSRGSQDLMSGSPYYYGYIGSHGVRYSNFILSKTDLIIAIGNRLAFPALSKSFAPIFANSKLIRIDIDEKEFNRTFPLSKNYMADAGKILEGLVIRKNNIIINPDWIRVCDVLRKELINCDITKPVEQICSYLEQSNEEIYVCDVGNNEFWFSRAFEKSGKTGMVLHSKSFSTLGVGLGRAIGAYYATRKAVCCVIGDQGFQFNLQELGYIKQWNIPIKILLLNNALSGMIADHEQNIFGKQLFHVNKETGYSIPDFDKIAEGYGVVFNRGNDDSMYDGSPCIYEIQIDSNIGLSPNLPKGRVCQDMEPKLDVKLYEKLERL